MPNLYDPENQCQMGRGHCMTCSLTILESTTKISILLVKSSNKDENRTNQRKAVLNKGL